MKNNMNLNNENKKKESFSSRKQVVILTAVIAMVLVVLIDTSYAWFVVTKDSEKTVGIKAGNLDLSFDDGGSSDIKISDMLPISDSDGENSNGYSFRIKNTGSIRSDYIIYLVDKEITTGEEKLNDKYMKYSISKNDLLYKKDFVSNMTDDILVSGSLESDEENTFNLKLWLDEESFDTDAISKVFNKTIKISASQHKDN